MGLGALCGLVYAVLTWLSVAPVGAWGLSLLAPVPILWSAARWWDRAGWLAIGVGLGTVPLWLVVQSWVREVAPGGYVPLAILLGAYLGLGAWVMARARRRLGARAVWLFPVLWVGMEVFRGSVAFDGYAWFLAAHPLIDSWRLASAGAVVGAYGVSLLVVSLGTAIVLAGERRARAAAGLGFGTAAVWLGLTMLPGTSAQDRAVRIGVVQTNVPQSNKLSRGRDERVRDMDRLIELSRAARAQGAEVIVWPETMYPGWLLDDPSLETARGFEESLRAGGQSFEWAALSLALAPATKALQRELGVPLVVGAEAYEGLDLRLEDASVGNDFEANFNSAFLIEGGEIRSRYDKLHLTPFGEVMPYISAWPWLERTLVNIGVGANLSFRLSEGSGAVVLDAGVGRLATPICFEATSPGVCRSLAYAGGERRAEVILNLTNDGWFGGSDPMRRHHEMTARWRAVELGLPLVRAANTGISGAFDHRGRVIGRLGARREGVLIVGVPRVRGGTVYGVIGDGAGWMSLGVTALVLVWSFVPGGRGGRVDKDRGAGGVRGRDEPGPVGAGTPTDGADGVAERKDSE